MSQAATRATTLVIRRDVSTSPLSCTRVCHVWCQCHAGDAAYAIWADGCTPIDVPDLLYTSSAADAKGTVMPNDS